MNTEKTLQLVTYEQAKNLKELGFDWKLYEAYNFNGKLFKTPEKHNHNDCDDNFSDYSAPTVALALKWCRNVKGFDCGITHRNLNRFAFWFKKPQKDNYEEWKGKSNKICMWLG